MHVTPAPRLFTLLIVLAALAGAENIKATILASESFDGYTAGTSIIGQGGSATGFSANWTAVSGPGIFTAQAVGLSMAGVYSSGGSALYSGTSTSVGTIATRAFNSALSPTSMVYGSYLFSVNAQNALQGPVMGIGTGSATESDNNATFFLAGDAYNSYASGLRVEGSSWIGMTGGGAFNSGTSILANTTYIYLFALDQSTNTATAWVLSAAQLANFSGSLDAATLNAATIGTGATNVWNKGTVTNASATLGAQTNLLIEGFNNGQTNYNAAYDELRFSNASLTEAVTAVPEPSTVALACLGGGGMLAACLRRRSGALS